MNRVTSSLSRSLSRSLALPLALLVALSLSGCGHDAPPAPPAVAPAPPAPPPPPAAPPPPPPAPPAAAEAPPAAPSGPVARVALLAVDLGQDPVSDAPRASLRVEVALDAAMPRTIDVGTLSGCSPIEDGTAPILRSVHCWWAGAGDLVTVAHEGDAIVVRRQGEDEESEGELPNEEVGRIEVGSATVEIVR